MGGYTESWVELEKSLGNVRPVLKGTAEEMRAQFAGLGSLLAAQYPPPPPSMTIVDESFDGTAYRVYTPAHDKGNLPPIGLYYHCGGFVMGGLDSDEPFCRAIAHATGAIIISVDYRLSPENKAPCHLSDSVKLFEWAYQHADQIEGNPRQMFTIGASAGATLALAVARKVVLRQTNVPREAIKGVVALCPATVHPENVPPEYRGIYNSYEENEENVPVIEKSSMLQYYMDSGLRPDDKQYFALLDPAAHKIFPPTYIATCAMDPLRDDGKAMERALSLASAVVRLHHYNHLPHCFWIFPTLPESEVFMSDTAEEVNWILGQYR